MGDSSTDVVVPRENGEIFGFAFNDFDFSDRVLRLEIIQDEKSIASGENLRGEKYHDGVKIVTLHINSAILAAKSPFFYKLFKNGMRESQDKNDVSLRINAREEASLMDVLKFMYENKLRATSTADLIGVLIAADKFEVTLCMRYSVQMLLKLPLSMECVLSYLELPSSVLVSELVKPLIDAAKQYIVAVAPFRDFTKSQKKAMELPLSAIEVFLGSEGLQVSSEDDVYDFILEWARAHYPELEERREILTNRLVKLMCFRNMSTSKLKQAFVCPDFDHEQVSKLVVEALFSNAELSHGQHIHASKDLATAKYSFLGRVYRPHCVVYFDIQKDELESLFQSKQQLKSLSFRLGEMWLYLIAQCCTHAQGEFGLFVCKLQDTLTCTLDVEFAVMNKSSMEFESKRKLKSLTLGLRDVGQGTRDLLGIPWAEFMSDDCDYFIDGILHLRVEVTLIKNSQP